MILHNQKLFIITNCYIFPQSNSTQHMFCKTYLSHLKFSHALLFVITKCLQLKPKALLCRLGHQNTASDFVTIGQLVQNFKCYRQTDRHSRTHEQHGDYTTLDFRKLAFPDSLTLCSLYTDSVCVCAPASFVEPADRLLRVKKFTHMEVTSAFCQFTASNNMVDTRI